MSVNLIGRTSRTDWSALPSAQGGAAARFDSWRSALVTAAGRDVAQIFAEPVFSTRAGDQSIAWYTELAGDPQPLHALDEEARKAPEEMLRRSLDRIRPLLADPALGPALASALYIGRREDLLVVGGQPVLMNWGHVPPKLASRDKPGLRRHFRETLGAFASFPAPDPFTAKAAAAGAAVLPPTPWRRDPAVRAWGVAAALAALAFAGLSFVPGILAAPRGVGLRPNVRAEAENRLALQRQINESLEQQIAALRAALEKGGQGGEESALPPAPDAARVRSGDKTQNLVELIDRSVAMIVLPDHKTSGSGFFVDATHIVTNFHVVKAAVNGGPIFALNRKLGVALEARYVAGTGKTGEADEVDFALLEVKPSSPIDALVLSNTGERLQNVVAAGFPGAVTQLDPASARLLEGNVAEMPDTNVAQGSIFSLFRHANGLRQWVHSAAIAPGSSGGPLLDLCGRVIGVNTAINRNADMRAGFAQSADNLTAFLRAQGIAFQQDDGPCQPQRPASVPPVGGAR